MDVGLKIICAFNLAKEISVEFGKGIEISQCSFGGY